jgi:hypothetical protein
MYRTKIKSGIMVHKEEEGEHRGLWIRKQNTGRKKMEQAEESFLRNTLEKGTEEEQKKLHGKFRQTNVLFKSIEEKERNCCT